MSEDTYFNDSFLYNSNNYYNDGEIFILPSGSLYFNRDTDSETLLNSLDRLVQYHKPKQLLQVDLDQASKDKAIADAIEHSRNSASIVADGPSYAKEDMVNYLREGAIKYQIKILRKILRLKYTNMNKCRLVRFSNKKKMMKLKIARYYNQKLVELSKQFHLNMIYIKNIGYRGDFEDSDSEDSDSYDRYRDRYEYYSRRDDRNEARERRLENRRERRLRRNE